MSHGKLHRFASMFEDVERVEIPIIQRDYAQGRPEAHDVRDALLRTLREHLTRDDADPAARFNLDFVYGNYSGDRQRFAVLDGQQRLTTLFLLHWYCAHKDGQVDEFRSRFAHLGHSRFSYATRPSAAEFFDALVRESVELPAAASSLQATIADSHWFFLSWRLDPTVQSCLGMLDAIHAMFADLDGLYHRLTVQGRITFEFLNLEQFGLSDDLYIKMNARGKPLTPFENFKAWLIGREGGAIAYPEAFDRKMDQDWIDVFWRMALSVDKETAGATSDALFMNFFYIIALYEACERGTTKQQSWLERLHKREAIAHSDFSEHASFSETTLARLGQVLDYFVNEATGADLALFQRALTGKDLMSLVEFYAVVRAICAAHAAGICPAASVERQRWNRVTYNLLNNAGMDDVPSFALVVRGLDGLSRHFPTLYNDLAETPLNLVGFSRDQLAEEQQKAALILRDGTWEPLLRKYEEHAYLRGKVGFLVEFSRTEDNFDQDLFDTYGRRAGAILDEPIRASGELLLERALLANWDYPRPRSYWRRSFCESLGTSFRDRSDNWFHVVVKPEFKTFLDLLGDGDVKSALERIIAGASCQDWRKHVIADPGLIGYCGSRFLRLQDGSIYLLSKIKSTCRHVELYSYALYRELKRRLVTGTAPENVAEVAYTPVTEGNPFLSIMFGDGQKLVVTYQGGSLVCHSDHCVVAAPEALERLMAEFSGPVVA
jgi:hypothetical protein